MSRVIIYGTQYCSWCKIVQKYLGEKNVDFEYIDVEQDNLAAELIFEKTGQAGVPVLNINGKYIVGFDTDKIDSYLEN